MIKILLDTDMGSDCDDAGALALLHNLVSENKAEILAVTHCASEISGAVAIKAINTWYGRSDIPVGRYETKPFLDGPHCVIYTKPLMDEYLSKFEMPTFKNAVRLMREVLAKTEDVTLVAIGTLNNMAELVRSEADDISPLSGEELIRKSVKELYVMGGNYEDFSAEYNIKCAIDSAKIVAAEFPVPVVYCGFEIGCRIITGKMLENAGEDHPVRKAYYIFNPGGKRESWDPITLYCAVEKENPLFYKSEKVKIDFDDDGKVLCEKGGKDCYLIMKDAEKVREVIDSYIR